MIKTVLVFKTSVTHAGDVERLQPLLDNIVGKNEIWNFDLEDCDRILRVEAISVKPGEIITHLTQAGYACIELEDYPIIVFLIFLVWF